MKKLVSKKELEMEEEKKQMEIKRTKLPDRNNLEMFGVITQLHGTTKLKVMCEDGIERMCRIPGKMKKKVWMRQGDVVLVRLWDFQKSKADVIWRYMGVQIEHLRNRGFLKNLPL